MSGPNPDTFYNYCKLSREKALASIRAEIELMNDEHIESHGTPLVDGAQTLDREGAEGGFELNIDYDVEWRAEDVLSFLLSGGDTGHVRWTDGRAHAEDTEQHLDAVKAIACWKALSAAWAMALRPRATPHTNQEAWEASAQAARSGLSRTRVLAVRLACASEFGWRVVL